MSAKIAAALVIASIGVPVLNVPATAATARQTTLWSFTGKADGAEPRGDLLVGPTGLLYGTASSGGINQSGTVFQIDPKASGIKEQTLYQFTGGDDGSLPSAGLISDNAGALYGTAARDGTFNAGTVFRLNPPTGGSSVWSETTLWEFSGGLDGAQPVGSLIADGSGSGVLYGTTSFGGANGLGTVFSLTPPANGQGAWTQATLWSFTGGTDGAKPLAALVQRSDGALFGTAATGGSMSAGTVFELAPPASPGQPWALTPIWTFTGGPDGATPIGTLTLFQGLLYGTTEFGAGGDCGQARYPYYAAPDSRTAPALGAAYIPPGGNDCGVVFMLAPPVSNGQPWTQTTIWSFTAGSDGGNPVTGVLIDSSGAVHGTTPEYGDLMASGLGQYSDKGNAYVLTPPAKAGGAYTETTTVSFYYQTRGDYTRGGLVAGPGGTYYATQTLGGDTWVHVKLLGYGAVISLP